MKLAFTKKPSQVDEETVREDEIDELSADQEDEVATAINADEDAPILDQNTTLEQLAQLESQLQEANDARMRALADYQNLVRRSQADRMMWSKLATQELVVSLLEPLEHLQRAAVQLSDKGLTMVTKQLFDRLEEQGLQKIEVLGKPFDETTMEAIAGSHPDGKKVTEVITNGYTLNGVQVAVAKVKVS